ncbi:MAG: hypothetical protein R2809_05555 [Flavobacteriales bacterium]
MKMRNISLGIIFLFLSAAAFAQPKENRKEKMEELKKTFIKEKLALTESEEAKFWPIFDAHEAKRKEMRKYMRQNKEKMDKGDMTEEELKKNIDEVTAKRIEEAQADAKFLKDCLPILGAKRVGELLALEDEFRRELMDELKQRRGDGPPPHRGEGPGRE